MTFHKAYMLILGLTVIACAHAQREASATQDTLPGTFDFTNQHSVIDEKERQFKQSLNTSISQSFKGLTSPLSGLLKQDSVQGKALLNSIKPTITLPRFSLKDPLRINGGYVGYNFDYRSNIDTSAAKQLAADAGYSNWVRPGTGAKESLNKFVGTGLSDNAATYLNAAAWKVGSKANFMASGYTEASSFNVEDMLVVGLLAKEGLKLLGGIAVKNVGLKEGKQLLLQAPEVIQRHHVLPQQFKAWFSKRGIKNIDEYTVEISAQTHLKGVHGNGLGNLPGQWNKKWSEFINTNPNASPSEIFNQAEGMLKQFGLEHLPYVPYKK